MNKADARRLRNRVDAQLLMIYGLLRSAQGRTEEAAEYFKKAHIVCPESREVRALVKRHLATLKRMRRRRK